MSFAFLPDDDKEEDEGGINKELESFWIMLRQRRMLAAIFYFLLAGAVYSFIVGFLHNIIESSLPLGLTDTEINKKTGLVFICVGIF
jgi:hypothetical protein